MSQLRCVGSGNKLQRQKKGPWNVKERQRKSTWREEEAEGKGVGVLPGCRACTGSLVLRVLKAGS